MLVAFVASVPPIEDCTFQTSDRFRSCSGFDHLNIKGLKFSKYGCPNWGVSIKYTDNLATPSDMSKQSGLSGTGNHDHNSIDQL